MVAWTRNFLLMGDISLLKNISTLRLKFTNGAVEDNEEHPTKKPVLTFIVMTCSIQILIFMLHFLFHVILIKFLFRSLSSSPNILENGSYLTVVERSILLFHAVGKFALNTISPNILFFFFLFPSSFPRFTKRTRIVFDIC